MTKQDLKDYYGSIVAAAEAIEVTPEAIYQWPEEIPKARAYEFQDVTNGKLKYVRPAPVKR